MSAGISRGDRSVSADGRHWRRTWSRAGFGLFALVVAIFLIGGLLQDLTELITSRGAVRADRGIFGWDENLAGRLDDLARAAAVVNAGTTVLIVVLGFAFLRASWRRTELRPAALILGLAALDSMSYAVVPPRAADVYFDFYWPALFAALVRFGAVFPVRLRPAYLQAPRSGRRLRRWAGHRLHALRRALLRPWVVWTGAAVMGLLIHAVLRPPSGVHPVPVVLSALVLVLAGIVTYALSAASYLRLGYALARPRERRRALWIVQGAVLYCTGFLFLLAVGLVISPLAGAESQPVLHAVLDTAYLLVVAAAIACLGVGVFYDGAIDPALVLRRTTLYGAAGVGAVFGVGVLSEIIEGTLAAWLGWSEGLGGLVAAGLVAVLLALVGRRARRGFGSLLERVLPDWRAGVERESRPPVDIRPATHYSDRGG